MSTMVATQPEATPTTEIRSESWLWAADELSGEDVLPGFRCKVDDLFPKPSEADAHEPDEVRRRLRVSRFVRSIASRIHRPNSTDSGERPMPHPHDTTEDHPPREPATVNGSGPDSFIPDKRVIEAERDPTGDRDALALAAEAAGRVAGSGRRFRPVFRQVAGPALGQARIAGRPVPRHHAEFAAPEPGRALQPMEADAPPASIVRGDLCSR